MSELSSQSEPEPEVASDKELGGLAGFILQAVSGSLMLLCVYLIITMGASVSIVTILIAGLFAPALNFVWIGVSISLSIYGAARRMPGIIWSPVIFCVAWFSAAVIHRTILALNAGTITTETVGTIPLLTDLRHTTLTSLGVSEGCCWYYKLLAEKQIAAYAWGYEGDLAQPKPQIELLTYAEGEACRTTDIKIDEHGTAELHKIGRLDECFLRRRIVGIPDGLIIWTAGYHTGGYVTDVIVREHGRDRTVINLGRQGGTTLAYLPIIEIGAPYSVNTWGAGFNGILRAIRGEKEQGAKHHVVEALFGRDAFIPITPKLDLRSPEIMARAAELLRQGDTKAALSLVALAQDAGNVSDVTYEVMAAVACDYATDNDNTYRNFVRSRTEEQSVTLLRKVFALAGDPRHPKDKGRCYGPLPSPGSRRSEFETAAHALFHSTGLGIWQYEFALAFLRCPVVELNSTCVPPQRDDIAAVVFYTDDPATFRNRVIAYKHQYILLNDDDIRGLARHLQVATDNDLLRFRNELQLQALVRKNADVHPDSATAQLREALKVRAVTIQDPTLKAQFLSWL